MFSCLAHIMLLLYEIFNVARTTLSDKEYVFFAAALYY